MEGTLPPGRLCNLDLSHPDRPFHCPHTLTLQSSTIGTTYTKDAMSSSPPAELKDASVLEANDKVDSPNVDAGEGHIVPDIDPKAERRCVAKLDLFITPVLFIVYLSCFIDRAIIGLSPRVFAAQL